VAANHPSHYDPVLLAAVMPRLPRFLAADELVGSGRRWRVPLGVRWIVRWAMQASRSIPVSRTGRDEAALRQAMRALAQGDVVVAFVEGGETPAGGYRRAPLRGAAWLARRVGCPVVPCRIAGLPARTLSRPRVNVRFGEPLLPAAEESVTALTERIWQAVGALDDRGRDVAPR
jgi:1-acyl-sn-glycerol-3-phosphate acyltransferase